jgi:hypothetical protein
MNTSEIKNFKIPAFLNDDRAANAESKKMVGEEHVIKKINEVMDSLSLKTFYSDGDVKIFDAHPDYLHKPFRLKVFVSNGKINFKALYPFRVREGAMLIMAVNIIKYNSKADRIILNLDPVFGELSMEYVYAISDVKQFDESIFTSILKSILRNMTIEYERLERLSSGMVPEKEFITYKDLLLKSLDVIDAEKAEKTNYGITRSPLERELRFEGRKADGSKESEKKEELAFRPINGISRLLQFENDNKRKADISEVRKIIEGALSDEDDEDDDDYDDDELDLSTYFEEDTRGEKN